ncbi:PAS domain S-box-containing protein [Pseudoxanthomonas sp. GM95]|uniref:sensor histidine kinase n=1 Tax=Pseudoxanthomonas sp. GM95 TaxID=1881043 RepID=UPI0008B9DC69|nr:ATP-binding protein [Pseudoxanthomonas sp. GM95]SEM16735.1 PAS domain S-box-containing protein [Pseudoxanthomonas sp. GM95]
MRKRLARVEWERWRLPFIGVAVLLIVVAPSMLRQQLQDQTLAAADLVSHTRQVQAELSAMNVEIREVEQSAILVSLGVPVERLRARVEKADGVIGPMLQSVMRLTRDSPDQQIRLGQLKEVLERRVAIAHQLLEAAPAERDALVKELGTKYAILPLMRELQGAEQRFAADRIAESARTRRLASWVGWGGLLVQLLLLTAVTAVLGRQIAHRLRAETRATRISERSAAVLQSVREPIVLLDGDQQVLMHNAAFAELYGLEEDTRYPLGLSEISEGWDDEVVRQRLTDVFSRGRELWDYEVQQETAGGVPRVLLLNARRMSLPDRDDEAVLMTVSDVTTQKTSQQRIIDLNRQLEGKIEQVSDVNRELEAFSYSVSHDLRAPLRHVSGFSDKLARHLGDAADERSRHYLTVIGDSARRMSSLIDDLLVYSRLGRSALRLQAVDMQSLVAETRSMLDANVSADKHALPLRVDWDIQPLPILVGDENMLRQVWQNLLGNAVKYSGKREVAQIQVGYALEGDGEHHFWVKDNGAGFDMAYASKLFGVFQRLHKASDYAGTGIGLASVRRVLSRHGGRVWAEAEPEQGATFHFVIPASQDSGLDRRHLSPSEFNA